MLKKLKIRDQLYLGFGSLLIILLGMGMLIFFHLTAGSSQSMDVEQKHFKNVMLIAQMKQNVTEIGQWLTSVSATGNSEYIKVAENHAKKFQQTSASAQEISSSVQSLAQMAYEMRTLVIRFKANGDYRSNDIEVKLDNSKGAKLLSSSHSSHDQKALSDNV